MSDNISELFQAELDPEIMDRFEEICPSDEDKNLFLTRCINAYYLGTKAVPKTTPHNGVVTQGLKHLKNFLTRY